MFELHDFFDEHIKPFHQQAALGRSVDFNEDCST